MAKIRKVPPNIFHPNDARVMDVLKQINLSDSVRKKMSLNEADQSFMIGLLDLYEDAHYEDLAEAIKPVFTKLENLEIKIQEIDKRTDNKRTWTIRVIIAVLIILTCFTLLRLFFPYMHSNWTEYWQLKKKTSYDWTIEKQMRVFNAPTRAIHYDNLTSAQKDSVAKENQDAILQSVKDRNEVYEKLSKTWKK